MQYAQEVKHLVNEMPQDMRDEMNLVFEARIKNCRRGEGMGEEGQQDRKEPCAGCGKDVYHLTVFPCTRCAKPVCSECMVYTLPSTPAICRTCLFKGRV